MRLRSVLCVASLAVCVVVANSSDVFAGGAKKETPNNQKKVHGNATPARPTGVAQPKDSVDAYYGGAKNDAITEYSNESGQTVYSIAASHFDISPPLREMAAAVAPDKAIEEEEAPTNPQLPPWRRIRSDLPDPVVQAVIPAQSLAPTDVTLAAPITGFNFQGVGINGGTPSDSNGSVGNNQFVETVNTRYQVWSLNRSTQVATSILGPVLINTLWSGFGGACQDQNSGDPIVLFDKTAKRWLISQFTSSASGGVYYQCAAVSTTADATGTYARYAFAVPGGFFGDYPHFGAWPNAYYMMAHGFGFGGSFTSLFAAMDRNKMLAGNPAATWQVIQDPNEGGHMPADLDGTALPPTLAPGIFVSLHTSGMFIYRMKVSFVNPAATVKTLQAIVPVAPATGACGGGTCIPQPGTGNVLDSIADRLMFRAAYRNFIDHESLVVSHSVDPSVSGVASGVRWYDFRLSGNPDATCPTYPCIHQQGTIADVANGRSRWMPSLAMDTAENILVGYTTSGKTSGSENHSIRYTGRAKGDPPGTMTVPETTIATGTANNTSNTRWGDYSSMSIDPFDDCTFWYVSQYYTVQNAWSTRIASAVFPAGSGAGECPATTCALRPGGVPMIGMATVPGDNQITVSWTGITPQPGSYAIERAEGACGSEGLYRPLAATAGPATSFTDTNVLGGFNYSYRVRAASDAAGKCQALLASACVSAMATGACNLKPDFSGATSATSSQHNNCGVTVSWTPAASGCPLTPDLRYNIFRGTTPDFVPSVANRIATCVVGPGSFLDTANLASGTPYYYVVRAEDVSAGNGGECAGGNEESNSVVVSGTAYGTGTQAAPGTWTDGAGDGSAFLLLNVAGVGDGSEQAWRYVTTANDPGANHTPGGTYAYRNAGPASGNTYGTFVCAEMQAPPLTVGATAVNLQYWERHQLEYHWDGVAVEYSVNSGAWTGAPAPSNSTALGCASSDATTGWEPLSCTQYPPLNACGYGDTKNVFTGPLGGGSSCADFATSATVTAYAHRCHHITGLTPDDTIRFRWRYSSDSFVEYAGFYLDDVAVTNIRLPDACTPDTCAGQADGTTCDDGSACTSTDTCGGSMCQSGAPVSPPTEVTDVQVDGHSNTALSWTALAGGVVYDVVSSTLSDLRANGTTTAACLANDLATINYLDVRPDPPVDDGYYYLIRAQSACGSGSYGLDSSSAERAPMAGCP